MSSPPSNHQAAQEGTAPNPPPSPEDLEWSRLLPWQGNIHFKRRGRVYALALLYARELDAWEGGMVEDPRNPWESPGALRCAAISAKLIEDNERFWDSLRECSGSISDKEFRRCRKFAARIVEGVLASQDELDRRIAATSQEWSVSRMDAMDRNILRIAAFELLNCHDTPKLAILDEAVELAKTYGTEKSPKFVNGILNSLCHGQEAPNVSGAPDAPETDDAKEPRAARPEPCP